MDLTTTYMGFKLKNPVIVGSSGLTSTVENVTECERNGAAAVVLRSLFEEQILEYLDHREKQKIVGDYLGLIRACKKAVRIPVLASINCLTFSEWTNFAIEIEKAGADGLELNIFVLPSDTQKTCIQTEELYIDILNTVVKQVSFPVSIKMSPYFSGLAKSALRFSFTGIKGMVMFNRFYSPDIDIEEFKVIPGPVFSSPSEISLPLRWIAMLSERIYCDIVASTGVHDGQGLVKVLLAGAKATQVCSALYLQGYSHIGVMLRYLEEYLKRHGFSSVRDITGKMSMRKTENPADFERVQFMKQFAGIE